MATGGINSTSFAELHPLRRELHFSFGISRRKNHISVSPSSTSGSRRMSISSGVSFRPCIDIHKGKVKQIVGSTLNDSKEDGATLITNFESDKSAADFAKLYKADGLTGGHVIMLGADPLSKAAAFEALQAYPDFPYCKGAKI